MTISDQAEKERMLAVTDRSSPLRGTEIGVGALYNRHTQHWLVWLSTNGLDISILCAYEDEAKAHEVVEEIIAAARSGDLTDRATIPALMDRWRSSGMEEPSLSDDIIVAIGRDILHHVVPLNLPKTPPGEAGQR